VSRLLDLACWVNVELELQWSRGGFPWSLVTLAQGYCHRLLRSSRGSPPFVDKQQAAETCAARGCPGCAGCAGDSAVIAKANVPELAAQALLAMRGVQALCAAGPGPRRALAGVQGLVAELLRLVCASRCGGPVSERQCEELANEAAATLVGLQQGDGGVRGEMLALARTMPLAVCEPLPGPSFK
jgi:hypothetical protein